MGVTKTKMRRRGAKYRKAPPMERSDDMIETLAQYPDLAIDSLVDFMIETMENTLLTEIETALDPVLQNKVCTVPLGMGELNTNMIEWHSVNHKYRKKEFPAHTSRFKKWTVLAFKRGKLVVNNVRTEEQMYYAISESFRFLRRIGAVTNRHFLSVARTNNNVLTGNAVAARAERCSVNLALLAQQTTRTDYDPEAFPSASIAFAGFLHQLDMKTAVHAIVTKYFKLPPEQCWAIVAASAAAIAAAVADSGEPMTESDYRVIVRRISCLPARAALQSIRYHDSGEANASIKAIASDTAIITVLGPKSIYEGLNAFYWIMRLLQPYLERETQPLFRNQRQNRRIEAFYAGQSAFKMLAPPVPATVFQAIVATEQQRDPNEAHAWNLNRSATIVNPDDQRGAAPAADEAHPVTGHALDTRGAK